MADLQLSLRYHNAPQKDGFGLMVVATPIWSLIIPGLIGFFIGHIISFPADLPLMPVVIITFTLFSLLALGILLTAISEDDRVHVSRDGLSFQPLLLAALKGRRNRDWSELTNANIVSDKLLLQFSDNARVALDLKGFNTGELEQLLLAVELWGKNCSRSPELVAYQTQIQNESRGIGELSYTKMWDEELGRRFHATSFVPLEPDKTLRDGKIKIVRQLAFGGFSAIYLAQKDGVDLIVLKEAVVPPSADPEAKKQAEDYLKKESKMLFGLSHPHIAKVLDFFVEDDRHYLVLEYIHGQDLRQLVKQHGAQPQEKVAAWAQDIISIMQYLHTHEPPIIHRDLTPDNIVLKNDGSLVLIDFGAANEFVGTATGTLIGKQAFIAPEQLRGKATPQSDIYSLAGTLFFLLTGKDPVPLSVSHPAKDNSSIDSQFDDLVASMSAFDGDKRPSLDEISNTVKELNLKLKATTQAGTSG